MKRYSLLFAVFILTFCGCTPSAPDAHEILAEAYGEYLHIAEDGSFRHMALAGNTEMTTALDYTETHAEVNTSPAFSLTADKTEYAVGENPRLTLTASEDCICGLEYIIEQNIGGRWYRLNMRPFDSIAYHIPAGGEREYIIDTLCGWYDRETMTYRYQLPAGSYRVVIEVRIHGSGKQINTSCDILIK